MKNKIIKVLTLLLVITMLFSLTSCVNLKSTKSVNENVNNRFTLANDNTLFGDFYIYVDKETKVQYICKSPNGGITPLIDADGKPILHEGELE